MTDAQRAANTAFYLAEGRMYVAYGLVTDAISSFQSVQKINPPDSDASQQASKELAPLFADMAARQKVAA